MDIAVSLWKFPHFTTCGLCSRKTREKAKMNSLSPSHTVAAGFCEKQKNNLDVK